MIFGGLSFTLFVLLITLFLIFFSSSMLFSSFRYTFSSSVRSSPTVFALSW